MKRATLLVVAASLVLAACGGPKDEAAAPRADARQPWAEFVVKVIDNYYRQNPESASDAGLHQYDGQMSDLSAAGLAAYGVWLDSVLAEAASYADLEGIEAFERDYLMTFFKGQLFWFKESGFPSKNPLFYSDTIGISVFIDREYAPLDQRLQAYTTYIEQLPGLLDTMKANLEPPLPAPYVEMGFLILDGMAQYLSTTVPEVFAPVENEQLQRRFKAANDSAVEDIENRESHWERHAPEPHTISVQYNPPLRRVADWIELSYPQVAGRIDHQLAIRGARSR